MLDKWELKRDDVQLLLDKPLGKGAFGEVYKGLLPPKFLSQMSNLNKLPGRKGTVNCVVAVKILKGEYNYGKIIKHIFFNVLFSVNRFPFLYITVIQYVF